jgi:hypothetical protein
MIRFTDHLKPLPGDVITALTCKHCGIDPILAFDEDFDGMARLKIYPCKLCSGAPGILDLGASSNVEAYIIVYYSRY